MNLNIGDLILRNVEASDIESVHSFASLEEICRYQTWGPNSLDDTKNYIAAAVEEINTFPRQSYNLAVTSSDGSFHGTCGIFLKGNWVAEIGFTLRKESWGKGIGTKVALALIDYSIHQLKQLRIIATCDVLNEGSNALLKKVGFKQTEILKAHMNIRGRLRDTICYEFTK